LSPIPVLKIKVADTLLLRLRGLLCNKVFPRDYDGLLLSPCNGIHTFFMRFTIDIIFLEDKSKNPPHFNGEMNCPSYDVNGAINITKKYLETLNEQPVVVLGTPKITGLTDVLSSPRILKLPISMESSSHASFRVIHLIDQIRPWTFSPIIRDAHHILELPSGFIKRHSIAIGDSFIRLEPSIANPTGHIFLGYKGKNPPHFNGEINYPHTM